MDLPTIAEALETAACVIDKDIRMETMVNLIQTAGSFNLLIEDDNDTPLGPLSYGGIPIIAMIVNPDRQISDNKTLAHAIISKLKLIAEPTKHKLMTAAGWLLSDGKLSALDEVVKAIPSTTITEEDILKFAVETNGTRVSYFYKKDNTTALMGTNILPPLTAIGVNEITQILESTKKLIINADLIGIMDKSQDYSAADAVSIAIKSLADASLKAYREGPGANNGTVTSTLKLHRDRLLESTPSDLLCSHILITGLPQALIKDSHKMHMLLMEVIQIESELPISGNTITDLLAKDSKSYTYELGGGRYGILIKIDMATIVHSNLIMGKTGSGKNVQKFKYVIHPLSLKQVEIFFNTNFSIMSVWRNIGTSSANIIRAKLLIESFLSKISGIQTIGVINLVIHGIQNHQPDPGQKNRYVKTEEICLLVLTASQQHNKYIRELLGLEQLAINLLLLT